MKRKMIIFFTSLYILFLFLSLSYAKTLLISSYNYESLYDILQIKGFVKEANKYSSEKEISAYRIVFLDYFANEGICSFSYAITSISEYIRKLDFDNIVVFGDVAFNDFFHMKNVNIYATGLKCSMDYYERKGINIKDSSNIKGIVFENIDLSNIINMLEIHPVATKIVVVSNSVEIAKSSLCMFKQVSNSLMQIHKEYKVINVLTTDELREKLSLLLPFTGLVIIAMPCLYDVSSNCYINLAKVSALVHEIIGNNSIILVPSIYFCKYYTTMDLCISADFMEMGKEILRILIQGKNVLVIKTLPNKTAINFRKFSRSLYRWELKLEDFDYVYGF